MPEPVTLRHVVDSDGTRELTVSLNTAGDLVIDGCDRGDGVERIFGQGNREYEWVWTIRAADVPQLAEALGENVPVLTALQRDFSGAAAADLKTFLDERGIRYDAWSRVGD